MIKSKEKKTMTSSVIIRKPAVAGSFYPASRQELDKQLTFYFNQTKIIDSEKLLRILIVPHAGIVYSGKTAAWGFKQIEGKDYRQIILLGVSHYAWFDHVAIFSSGVWETPLGKVEIDKILAEKIIDKKEKILADPSFHIKEHCLEVELVFLQKVLKNFKILPILVSYPTKQLIDLLARKISENFNNQTLLVISSDLSHYPSWQIAREVDEKTISAILSGKSRRFEEEITTLEKKNYPGVETLACGYQAIIIGLKTAEILEIDTFQKLKYENSGDIPFYGDKNQVVGYAAIAGYSQKLPKAGLYLDEESQKEALSIARKTLEEFLVNKKIPLITTQKPDLSQPLGCFVTLRKNGQLRGCMGEFESKDPLFQVVQRVVIASATKDPRFLPVTADELKDITIEISVISPKRKIKDWRQIKLGKQGVVIEKGLRGGTFLPQVAGETGWNLEEFLSHLCVEKAGLPFNCYKDPAVSIYVFEAQVFEEKIKLIS